MHPHTNRTIFLIDSFNLYHSVKNASDDLGLSGRGTRWLNVYALCGSYLHAIGNNAQIYDVLYFSALARHIDNLKPGTVKRHLDFIECLKDTGVSIELSRFKPKTIKCNHCSKNVKRYEEKETDVALAVKLLEVLLLDRCDTVVLVTGDTDIVPAVKTAKRLFPKKTIGFLLPYKRHNQELMQLTSLHMLVKKEAYANYQFSDPYITSDGRPITKPPTW